MMYDEFLALGGERVKHITFIEYATLVEPLFEELNIWDNVFIERLIPLLDEIEASTVNDVINRFPIEVKADILAGEPYMNEYIQRVALEARKLIYQKMRLEELVSAAK